MSLRIGSSLWHGRVGIITQKMPSISKGAWRNAASLILVQRASEKSSKISNGCDYKVLMVKRSSKSSFMPNALVFPGGVTDDTSDFSNCWTNIIVSTVVVHSLDQWVLDSTSAVAGEADRELTSVNTAEVQSKIHWSNLWISTVLSRLGLLRK